MTGRLTVTDGTGESSTIKADTEIDQLRFPLPTSAADAAEITYAAEFTFADGTRASYPAAGGTMSAVAISRATTVDLGTAGFSHDQQDPGDLVVSGDWGTGPDEFGIDPQLSGPSSFDVDPRTGDIVVLDQVNARIVRVSPDGTSRPHPIDLHPGLPDLAVAPDGSLDVLYVNAVSGASLQQFSANGGTALREIELATPSANAIRRVGDTVFVEADDSYWVPVTRGTDTLSVDEQVASATSGVTDGDHLVIRKHLLDQGNEVRVADSADGSVRAWRLTGTTLLGAVPVAAPLPDGDVVVVQSQYDDDHAQYSILTLGDGETRVTVAPHARYADLYDPSEFRLDGDDLYQLRSTVSGFAIYRYRL